MKAKITQTDAKRLHCTKFGYCEIQNLLKYETPVYYTCGYLGRKADFYKLEHPKTGEVRRISTGYSPTGERNPVADYKTIQKAEEKSYKTAQIYGKTKQKNRLILYKLCFGKC